MSERGGKAIELRIAREPGNEFLYLGLSRDPGEAELRKALTNRSLYSPHGRHANEDGSVTVEWLETNLGWDHKKRRQNFYKYVADLVRPQLRRATGSEVLFVENELTEMHLQDTSVKRLTMPPYFSVDRTPVGTMSLFLTAERALDEAARTDSVGVSAEAA